MGLFSKFFSSSKSNQNSEIPKIQFGRYTDRNKSNTQRDNWSKAIELYKEEKYLDAYDEFFKYLKDPEIENVIFERKENQIDFEIVQGSKKVKGYVTNDEIHAESEVVGFEQPNVAVMRKLLTENYYLWFSKFAIKDNIFTIKHHAPSKDTHPSALYFALKEVANVSDGFDDVLVDEFPFLKPINISHIQDLPEKEKMVKLKYFKKWIKENLEKVQKLNADHFAGACAYILLNLTYKLYYLLAPEGTLLDELRNIQNIYFIDDGSSDSERNRKMIEKYNSLLEKNDEEHIKSLYKVKATFAVVKPTHYTRVANFIKEEIDKIQWYKENKHFDIQQAICEYIVAYACFYFGMNTPTYELFDVFWHTLNFKYYEELEFPQNYYDLKSNKINGSKVTNAIQDIISHAQSVYPKLTFNTNSIDFKSTHDFATSFIYEFINCNFDEKEK